DGYFESAGGGLVGGGGSDAAAGAGDDENGDCGWHGGWILAGGGDGASPVSTRVHMFVQTSFRLSNSRGASAGLASLFCLGLVFSARASFACRALAARAGSWASEAKRRATSCDSVSSGMRGRRAGSSRVCRRNLSSRRMTRSCTLRA